MNAPITAKPAIYPAHVEIHRGDITITATAGTSDALATYRAMEQVKQAGYYRHLTACAQGMGYDGITDALSALAALKPVAYVRADTLAGLNNPRNDGVGASLFKTPLDGRVGLCLAPGGKGGAA